MIIKDNEELVSHHYVRTLTVAAPADLGVPSLASCHNLFESRTPSRGLSLLFREFSQEILAIQIIVEVKFRTKKLEPILVSPEHLIFVFKTVFVYE